MGMSSPVQKMALTLKELGLYFPGPMKSMFPLSLVRTIRVATVALLLVALLVSVGYTGQGKIVCKPVVRVQVEVEQTSDGPSLLNTGSVEPSGGKMAPSKTTSSIPAIINAVPMVFKSVDEKVQSYDRPAHETAYLSAFDIEPISGRLPQTLAMISTRLGRQATLVGAKPSGTM